MGFLVLTEFLQEHVPTVRAKIWKITEEIPSSGGHWGGRRLGGGVCWLLFQYLIFLSFIHVKVKEIKTYHINIKTRLKV